MKAIRLWQGVRMRVVAARPDPDQPLRLVTLPVAWDDDAAAALAALLPGDGPVSLAAAAGQWLTLIAVRARQAGRQDDIAVALHAMLRQRRMAPNQAVWRGEADRPGFRLNLAGFHEAASGFDSAGFVQAARLAAVACRLLAPAADRYEIGMAGLDDLLAALGIAYDSRAARDLAGCLAALLRGCVDQALESDQRDLLATPADWPPPPRSCAVPGLAEAAWQARAAVSRAPDATKATGIFPGGPAEALLGVETAGVAPAFSPVRGRRLTRAAQDRLAAAAMSPEAALASMLLGEAPLPVAGRQAHLAMLQAVAPYLDLVPDIGCDLPAPDGTVITAPAGRAPVQRRLPARQTGLTQKITLGGHRVFLRTAEYPDGSLGEVTLTLPRESAAVRGLAEGFAQALSVGLQHGIGLEAFLEGMILTRFGFAGEVEGDPEIDRATSLLDYVARTLAASYLRRRLPAPDVEEDRAAHTDSAPLLPLDLPHGAAVRARRRSLRLVA
jgi:hypothetical protein